MATYTFTINERSVQGKALLAYLGALKIDLQRVKRVGKRKGSLERSIDDIRNGRVETFASAEDMCNALGI